jgi:hypothetical protein
VSIAREQLLKDVTSLNVDKMPRLPARRNKSDNQAKLEIEDITTLLTFIDENGLWARLPRYVSRNPEQLPQLRIEKGDVTLLRNKIDNIEKQLEIFKSLIGDIIRTNMDELKSAIATGQLQGTISTLAGHPRHVQRPISIQPPGPTNDPVLSPLCCLLLITTTNLLLATLLML